MKIRRIRCWLFSHDALPIRVDRISRPAKKVYRCRRCGVFEPGCWDAGVLESLWWRISDAWWMMKAWTSSIGKKWRM